MRNAFVEALIDIAEKDERIILLTGDLGFTVFEEYIARFPARFINVGVAEANMIGIACGLWQVGYIPVTYSIATFISMRAFEQIRNDIALSSANVKIVGVGAGLSYSHAGPTHHAIEDISLMRVLPGMSVFTPADSLSTYWMTKTMLKIRGPVYLRLGKKGEPVIYQDDKGFRMGKGVVHRKGTDCILIATGTIVHNVLQASKLLQKKGISAGVIDIFMIKPIDRDIVIDSVRSCKFIFTVEEHTVIGGLGSAVAEILSEEACVPYVLRRIGLNDEFSRVIGDHNFLRRHYSLSAERIAAQVEGALS